MTAPIADVPMFPFFFGTLFGLIPSIVVNVQIGAQIDDITNMGISMQTFMGLILLSFVCLIPTLVFKKGDDKKKSE